MNTTLDGASPLLSLGGELLEGYKQLASGVSLPGNVLANAVSRKDNMLKIAQFLLVNARETAKALLGHRLMQFDALVGNQTCELVALEAARIAAKNDVKQEAKELLEEVIQKIDRIHRMKSRPANAPFTSQNFLDPNQCGLAVSAEMLLLIQLNLLKVASQVKPREGRPADLETNVGKAVAEFSRDIDRDIAKSIVYCAKAKVAEHLLNKLQEDRPNQSVFAGSLVKRITVSSSAPQPGKPPVATVQLFSTMLFYNIAYAMEEISEKQMLVVVKKIPLLKQSTAIALLFRISQNHLTTALDRAARKLLPSSAVVIVVEGVVPEQISSADLQQHIEANSLNSLMLTTAAQERQYSGTHETDPAIPENLREEIAQHQAMATTLRSDIAGDCVFRPDHLYCSSLLEQEALLEGGKS